MNLDQTGDKESIVDQSVEDGVENDKCVVGQYKTTLEQKIAFKKHISSHPKTAIPVEWVIDIADEANGWFYGTAYHFDDTTQMLHVMVPDKQNPSFDGNVVLDHRTVHLIECVDGKTEALFNKVVRDSVVKVKWEVEWFEEDTSGGDSSEEGANGKWVISTARYYIRMANQLLVEDENFGSESRGFVMLTADLNVKLRSCYKGKGQEDFNRLVNENITQSTPEAFESVKMELANEKTPVGKGGKASAPDSARSNAELPSIRKMEQMSKGLRECVSEVLDEREKALADKVKMSEAFNAFVLDGDLEAGLLLMGEFENAKEKDVEKENTADEAWYLVQKLEKNISKLAKAGDIADSSSAGGSEEAEALKKMLQKMKKQMDEKEQELDRLRGRSP